MATLHVDYLSQPSRSVIIFCRQNKLPVTIVNVRLALGEHKKPEYLRLNPLGKVPALVDGDLCLPESAAILLYLCRKFPDLVAPSWYPATDPERALADAAMHWQHTTVRLGSMRLMWNTVVAPKFGAVPSPVLAADGLATLRNALRDLEGVWLQATPFMKARAAGLADLLCCCELQQLQLLSASSEGPSPEELFAPYPRVRAWMARVASATAPHYQELDQYVAKATGQFKAPDTTSSL